MRSLSGHARREEARRRRREEGAALPERVSSGPEALLERLELRKKVVEEVTLLPEPYRSTVLLRFFDEMSLRAIAGRQGVSVDTVKTRLRRALDLLRSRFDRLYRGDREAWCLAFLPLAGWERSGAVAAGAASAGASAGGSGMPGAVVGATFFSGGALMSTKMVLAAAAVGLVALAVGLGAGLRLSRQGRDEAMARYSLVPGSQLVLERERAASEIDRLKAAQKELERERQELAGRLAKIQAARKTEDAVRRTSIQASLPLPFGKFAGLEPLREAKWTELAGNIAHLQAFMARRMEKLKEGMPGNMEKEDWEENEKLVKFGATLVGKLPTHQWGAGEFTHPVVLTNLTAALLENEGAPLTESQRTEVARLGAEYEKESEELQQSYGAESTALEKVVDELALKQELMSAIRKVLRPEQLDLVAPPEMRDRLWLSDMLNADCLSPSIMAQTIVRAEYLASASDVFETMPVKIAERYGLDETQRAQAAPAFDAWYRAVERILVPVHRREPSHIDTVIAAGRAFSNLQKELLALPGLDDKTRSALAKDPGWFLPLVEKK